MTEQEIKDSAPSGATHYYFTLFGIIAYLNHCTDGYYYWSVRKNDWGKSFSNYENIKPL